MTSEKAEKDILSLVTLTGQDREKVIRALYVSNGDAGLAQQVLVQGVADDQQTPPAAPPQDISLGESSGSNRSPLNEGEGGRSEEEDGEVVVARRGRLGEAEGEEGTSRSNLKFANVKFHLDVDLKRKRRAVMGTAKDTKYLTLKVIRPFQEASQNEIHFRVKQTTQLGKLKRSYSERIGVPLYLLRFLYDGRRITDEHTPEGLEMESDDFVEVYDELGSQNINAAIPNHNIQYNQSNPGTSRESERGESSKTAGQLRRPSFTIEQDWGYTEDGPSRAESVSPVGSEDKGGDDDEAEEEEEAAAEGEPVANKKARIDLETLPSPQINIDLKADPDVLSDMQKIKLKYDSLVKKLRDKVECPVCLDVPKRAPIPVCINGHVVCQNCLRSECPTCRARMDGATSILAVTVIENIEHICEWDECTETFTLDRLPVHMKKCSYRMVECPGLECKEKHSLSRLLEHSLYCCIENNEITHYSLPHKFTYLTKKDIHSIQNNHRMDLNWKLEGIKYDDKIFFVKVCCERRSGRARWYFMVQMLGGAESCNKYTLNLVVFKGRGLMEGTYSFGYCGDVCPIDISSNHEAYEKSLCLTMIDSSMENILTKNLETGNYEFSVMVNIFKSKP